MAHVIYIQYTNPAGYPPLEHSSRILARSGWDVLFLGAAAHGADALRFPPHARIEVRRLAYFGAGVLQKLNYLVFVLWAVTVCVLRRPAWIYVSDPMAALPANVARRILGCRVIYHEHDSPSYAGAPNRFQRLFRAARQKLATVAEICVLPQAQRMAAFIAETQRTAPTCCVWNCPRVEEIARPRPARDPGAPVRFHYHGSINRERLPLSVLDALGRATRDATLTVVGYETIGSKGYLGELRAHAERLGLGGRVVLREAMSRSQLFDLAGEADVGLSFMPLRSADANLTRMVGASNKPFDYLAVGMMLLVSELAEWQDMYVVPGYALACDPSDVESLAAAMAWCVANPDSVRAKGEAGRRRVAGEWNYERQFADVEKAIAAIDARSAPRRSEIAGMHRSV